MGRISKKIFAVFTGVILLGAYGALEPIHSKTPESDTPPGVAAPLPVVIETLATARERERPPVAFDHDRHVKALKQTKMEDCGICHKLKARDERLTNPQVAVFTFPKKTFDEKDRTASMTAYHEACVSCHKQRAGEGKSSGPAMGLCGKCHVKRPKIPKVVWPWKPIFNYARHNAHVKALDKVKNPDKLGVAGKVELIGQAAENKWCQLCHHSYDSAAKKLILKKDTENACGACHKDRDEKNARAMRKVAHAACIGCHMKLAEREQKGEIPAAGVSVMAGVPKKFGPSDCKGCHGEHKELTPEEIRKIPRLVRGQKDNLDLALVPVEKVQQSADRQTESPAKLPVRMKVVPFNHKAHEVRGQFCSTCHHHSLEKCGNCHTIQGDRKKGGGITYYQTFHTSDAERSCAGCHVTAKEDKKCSGCHRYINAQLPQSSCTGCHAGPCGGVAKEVAPLPLEKDKKKVPEKVEIKRLEKDYKPAVMPHMKIVNRLITISNESTLGRRFHSLRAETLCLGCHHNSQPQAEMEKKPPECASCHGRPFDSSDLAKPGLQTAYHQQCAGCHRAMGQKPAPLECEKCHQVKIPGRLMDKMEIPLQGYAK